MADGYDATKEEKLPEEYKDNPFRSRKEKQEFVRQMQDRQEFVRQMRDRIKESESPYGVEKVILEMEPISDDVRVTSITPNPDTDTDTNIFERKHFSKNISCW